MFLPFPVVNCCSHDNKRVGQWRATSSDTVVAVLSVPLSVLDIAMIERERSNADALRATVELARRVDLLGYRRVAW